ncbi:MAG: LarC family nickel insertion protein [Rhodospirillales bacterium]
MIHIHLDPVGGIAGDMFVAAMVDAFPRHRAGMLKTVRRAGLPAAVECRVAAHRDHALTGKRFVVDDRGARNHHTTYREIRDLLARRLPATGVLGNAAAIFLELAQAEGKVHGISYRNVAFHELGGWDSIADIVAAAYLIHAVGVATWSVGPLPLGSGRVRSAHGILPVPAPATALLLKGFATFDDGIPGERVTPTGAAILKHLIRGDAALGRQPRRLSGAGIGFGQRKLPGISNVLRAMVFDGGKADSRWLTDFVAAVEFEVDDQSPEDLAAGLERLRATPGMVDVVQWPVFGKKGRVGTHVQALCRPERRDAAIEACFRETTTIGLRVTEVERPVLPRLAKAAPGGIAVKSVVRPGGRVTAKAEIDSVAGKAGAAERDAARRRAAESVLRKRRGQS